MSLFLDWVLTQAAMPLGSTIAVGLLALAALAFGRRRVAVGLFTFAVVWLWGWSTPLVARALDDSLSHRYAFQPAEALPAADAIVMLGAGASPNPSAPSHPNMDAAVDRIWHAARLYRAGKAPLIIVSHGFRFVGGRRPDAPRPAQAAQALLLSLGVPPSAIIIEQRSRNTRQNALYTAELAAERGIRKMLLATSAWHMLRAEAAFRQVGLAVVPAATDYLPPSRRTKLPWSLRLIPTVSALSVASRSFREYLGLLVYRVRGWA